MSADATDQSTPCQPPVDCPDPTGPYVGHQVDVAAAKLASTLYTADAVVVDKFFAALDGAQATYAKAKEGSKAAFVELTARVGRIKDTLEHVLDQQTRDKLTACWNEVLTETGTTPAPDCATIDALNCDKLPGEIAQLRAHVVTAAACVAQVDAEFTELADLPKTLGARVTELAGKATALEAEVCGTRTDPERRFVEYLQLQKSFDDLNDDWIDPVDYGCRLRRTFVTLVRRHTVSICLQVAVHRWDKKKELEEQARAAKAKNVVDLVLECSRRPADTSGGNGGNGGGTPCEPPNPGYGTPPQAAPIRA